MNKVARNSFIHDVCGLKQLSVFNGVYVGVELLGNK